MAAPLPNPRIEINLVSQQNGRMLKTKDEWNKPYVDKHFISIEDTPNNRKFVSFLQRLAMGDEHLSSMRINIAADE
jgi:hypothetical protein